MNLYKIDGGIGKNIAFTGLIAELVKKDGEICIETAYPEVFYGIEGIARVYNSSEPKDMTKFYRFFDNIYAHDPYIGNMFKGNVHVTNAWASMFGLKQTDKPRLPMVSVQAVPEEVAKVKEQLGDKPYFVIQISGGQSPYEIRDMNNLPAYENNQMRAGRNMVGIDALYTELREKFPDHQIVQFALPNEPQLKDAIQLQTNYVVWFDIFKDADFFVGIDSMLQHYMASIQKPGIVFWDMNTPEQFGYEYEGVSHYTTSMPGGVSVSKSLAITAIKNLKADLEVINTSK